MIPSDAVVFIVDDDELIRDSLEQLIKSTGLKAETFSSAQAFLDVDLPDFASCLILDIRMPGLSGLELQNMLIKRGTLIPIIFITGHGTVPMSVRAMKAGAMDFLQKPFEDQELLDLVNQALVQNKQTKEEQATSEAVQKCIDSLTNRELDILLHVVTGMLNKQIAFELNISESTVKTHRARIMKKMEVESFADLVRATELVGLGR